MDDEKRVASTALAPRVSEAHNFFSHFFSFHSRADNHVSGNTRTASVRSSRSAFRSIMIINLFDCIVYFSAKKVREKPFSDKHNRKQEETQK